MSDSLLGRIDDESVRTRLGALRLEPFKQEVPVGQVPCNEVSDPDALCPCPVVSVLMTTYNHADNIRQSVEGVMMQQTNFPFELVIGEDASQDGTREICFELQKRHPDRIRVLWSPTNVYAINGNVRRVRHAVRGEFIAYCEGDDRWIDAHKLQRQVDLMRAHPEVGICLGGTEVEHVGTGRIESFPYAGKGTHVVPGRTFVEAYLGDGGLDGFSYRTCHFQTSGYLVRREAEDRARRHFAFGYEWNWRFGDLILLTTVAMVADVAFVFDAVSRYRLTDANATARLGASLLLDGLLYELYLRMVHDGCSFDRALSLLARRLRRPIGAILASWSADDQRKSAERILRTTELAALFLRPGYRLMVPSLRRGTLDGKKWRRILKLGRLMECLRPWA